MSKNRIQNKLMEQVSCNICLKENQHLCLFCTGLFCVDHCRPIEKMITITRTKNITYSKIIYHGMCCDECHDVKIYEESLQEIK